MDKKSRIWTFAVIAFVVAGSAILAANRAQNKEPEKKIEVIATIYPLAEFARAVGGDRVRVTTLVTPGMEPHDYEPSAREVANIHKADLLVYNGAGLEPWVGRLERDIKNTGVMLADASTGADLRTMDEDGETIKDPHLWLDPVSAMAQVDIVKKGLLAVDPDHAYDYVGRAEAYIKKLAELDKQFTTGLATCQSKKIITSHQSLGYLATRYNLEAIGIAGLSPEDEPSPQKLAEIADFVRANDITHIFFETNVSPKLSQTIAQETGARTISFNPLESLGESEVQSGKNYLSVQRDNLRSLQTALRCATT